MIDKGKLVELLRGAYGTSFNAPYLSEHELEPLANHLIANGVTFAEDIKVPTKWISVEERLPEAEQIVLVSCKQNGRRYQCLAFYVPKKWLREQSNFNWDYEACDEYCEEADDYYVNEGWYERIYNWDDYNAVGIGDFVTHWMPLPEPPKGE